MRQKKYLHFFVLFLLIFFFFGNYKLISENGLRKTIYIPLNVSKVYESFKEKKAVLNKEKNPDRCLRQFDQLKIKTMVEKIKNGMQVYPKKLVKETFKTI